MCLSLISAHLPPSASDSERYMVISSRVGDADPHYTKVAFALPGKKAFGDVAGCRLEPRHRDDADDRPSRYAPSLNALSLNAAFVLLTN